MENINITEKDRKKYIDGEEVLCEYDCWTNWIVIRFFLFLFLVPSKKVWVNSHLNFLESMINQREI